MKKILNNLIEGECLYETSKGTQYLFIRKSKDKGIVYSINQNSKTLPFVTINKAFQDNKKKVINSDWYRKFNEKEYKSRPCNLSVLRKLLERF